MISREAKKGTIRFAYLPQRGAKATTVSLAGDFTNWAPTRMAKQKDGLFVAVLPVPAGEHEYKFVVDGQWIVDRDNPRRGPNPFGTMNSVLVVD